MKKTTLAGFLGFLVLVTGIAANQLQVTEVDNLPANCRNLGSIKVGDIAMGKTRAEVVSELKREAMALGANQLQMDIKRVNHPKMGVYYWGWGTVASCK